MTPSSAISRRDARPCRARAALSFAALSFLLSPACGGDDEDQTTRAPVVVMTRNLFLGSDLSDVLAATTPDIRPAVAALWANVQASDIEARIERIAEEIVEAKPDLVGLQEVELFRVGASDFDANPVKNVTEVRYDFLQILLDRLAARGAPYQAFVSDRADAELPALDAAGAAIDVRITDRDAILAKEGVVATNLREGTFGNRIDYTLAGTVPLQVNRGWALIDARVGEAKLTFANTHLEVGDGPQPFGSYLANLQVGQADELAQELAKVEGPLVLVGDINSPATGEGTQSYELLSRRLTEGWPEARGAEPGLTCCDDLRAPSWTGRSRIDVVFHRSGIRATAARIVGTDPAQRTPSGLWPSDHAGVVMTLAAPVMP